MKLSTNPQLETAYEFVRNTNQNIFLTGKAGTGKTTFLTELRKHIPKRMVVVAPTGVAAINAGGVTIHSFFQISFGPQIPDSGTGTMIKRISGDQSRSEIKKLSREKIAIIRSLDLLVIDEISMVRADLLDAVDEVLRRFRGNHTPFGGVQLLMIGDLQQLAPVVKEDEWDILEKYYDTAFFFGSRALAKSEFVTIELKEIFRQSNRHFIDILNKIRDNEADSNTLKQLNSRYSPDFDPDDREGYIRLTTHNQQAKNINLSRLEKIKGKEYLFTADIKGEFPEFSYPTEASLTLKKGAQVMFVRNDASPEKLYFNGKIGRITEIDDTTVKVECTGDSDPIPVEPVEWQNITYRINEPTREITEEIAGTFTQYPLKLAWAITIHKSQGLTFEKAIIDARASFAHGQVYVALSRCRSLEGLVLSSMISTFSIRNDASVKSFSRSVLENPPSEAELEKAKNDYMLQLFTWLFDLGPLRYRIVTSIKIWGENKANASGNLEEQLSSMLRVIDEELIAVSGKFCRQLGLILAQNKDFDTNQVLLDRLAKAGTWFLEKLETGMIKPLGDIAFSTDNREIRKNLDGSLRRISETLYPLVECMKVCRNGFSVATFTAVRAKAAISKPDYIHERQGGLTGGKIQSDHPELLNVLDSWRYEKAKESRKEPYQVLPRKTMVQITSDLPVTKGGMNAIPGMGKIKWKLYGAELIKIVLNYCMEKGIDLSDAVPTEEDRTELKTDSKKISYDMFVSGKSVRKIAMERELAESTIEGHLAYFVGKGMLLPDQLVATEKVKNIAAFFQEHADVSYADAKAELGDQYSYGEIKIVRIFMENFPREELMTLKPDF
jgi:hypothetical protein